MAAVVVAGVLVRKENRVQHWRSSHEADGNRSYAQPIPTNGLTPDPDRRLDRIAGLSPSD
jgi:hypothetical protein